MALEPKLVVAPPEIVEKIEELVGPEVQRLIVKLVGTTGLGALSITSAILNVIAYGLVDIDKQAASDFLRALGEGMGAKDETDGLPALERARESFYRLVLAYHEMMKAVDDSQKGTIQ